MRPFVFVIYTREYAESSYTENRAPNIQKSLGKNGEIITGSEIKLNFHPLIKQFNLVGNYVLIHWQAKPKGLRRFGVYCSTDSYRAVDYNKLVFDDLPFSRMNAIQVDENYIRTVPTAVLHIDDCTVNIAGEMIIIKQLNAVDKGNGDS